MFVFVEDIRARFSGLWTEAQVRLTESQGKRRLLPWMVAIVAIVLTVYYPLGMILNSHINDDPAMPVASRFDVPGGSKAIAIAETVVAREAEHWLPNAPFWHPAAALDNAPNFQLGALAAVARFVGGVTDDLGRAPGVSAANSDLVEAAQLLAYDGTTWYWGQGNIAPMAKAESEYREALQYLSAYNNDVAGGKATYARYAENLAPFLATMSADLAAASATLDTHAARAGGAFDFAADDIFFNTRGRIYAYAVIFNAMKEDFAKVLEEKQARTEWNGMVDALRLGATMDPLIVVNGRPDSMMPSHLYALEAYLLRARAQMDDLREKLQK